MKRFLSRIVLFSILSAIITPIDILGKTEKKIVKPKMSQFERNTRQITGAYTGLFGSVLSAISLYRLKSIYDNKMKYPGNNSLKKTEFCIGLSSFLLSVAYHQYKHLKAADPNDKSACAIPVFTFTGFVAYIIPLLHASLDPTFRLRIKGGFEDHKNIPQWAVKDIVTKILKNPLTEKYKKIEVILE